jgi:glycogenin glucosyltransferase
MTFKNPEEKLDELRRSSLIEFEHLKQPNHPMAPLRELPEHSVAVPETAVHHNVAFSPDDGVGGHDGATNTKGTDSTLVEQTAANPPSGKPLLKEPDFGADGASDKTAEILPPKEDVLSPTQTAV